MTGTIADSGDHHVKGLGARQVETRGPGAAHHRAPGPHRGLERVIGGIQPGVVVQEGEFKPILWVVLGEGEHALVADRVVGLDERAAGHGPDRRVQGGRALDPVQAERRQQGPVVGDVVVVGAHVQVEAVGGRGDQPVLHGPVPTPNPHPSRRVRPTF